MKNFFILPCMIFTFASFCQELRYEERVYGPIEYYAYQASKISSLVVPPVCITYKVLECAGQVCPDSMRLGVSGIIWAASFLAWTKYVERHPKQNEIAECSVTELTHLIADFPEVIDNLSIAKRNDYMYCPALKLSTCKLRFSVSELEQMFQKCVTYYGLDTNNKPCGQIIVDEKPIMHPLITAWAKNRHYWKHW